MNRLHLAVLLVAALLLGGCSGIDKERAAAALAAAETQATHLAAFVTATAPQAEALAAAAADSGNPTAAAAAARILSAYEAARAALPEALAAITTAKHQIAQLESDGAGKVPWWSVAGGLLLTMVPRLVGALVPPAKPLAEFAADLLWRVTATKRQKSADLAAQPPKA